MNKTNMALLGFVSSAADYLKNRAGEDGEAIKDLADIDFEKLKKELENGSSFDDIQDNDEELIRAGKETFDRLFNTRKKSGLINEFDELFNVDFGNREKDLEMQNHLLQLLKDPTKEYSSEFNIIAEAVNGQETARTDDRADRRIPAADDKQMDDIFDEILVSEKSAKEGRPEDTAVLEENDGTKEEQKKEDFRRLSELLHSFANKDYGFEQEDLDRLFAELDLSEIKKERKKELEEARANRSLSDILRDVKNENEGQSVETTHTAPEEPEKTLSDSLREIREEIPAVPSVFGAGYEPPIGAQRTDTDLYGTFYIANPGSEAELEEKPETNTAPAETKAPIPVETKSAETVTAVPEEREIDIDIDELFSEVTEDDSLRTEAEPRPIAPAKTNVSKNKGEEVFVDIEKILDGYKDENEEVSGPVYADGKTAAVETAVSQSADIIERAEEKGTDILDELLESLGKEAGENRTVEETKEEEVPEEEGPQPQFIMNPGTEPEEVKTVEEAPETDALNDLLDGLDSEIIAERIEEARLREEEEKGNIYDAIKAIYPYLSDAFIRAVYDLKGSLAYDYPEDVEIVILHRLRFTDIDGLHNFVEVIVGHGYTVNVDEKQMIVDVFKSHINADGRILTDIFEIANQARLLSGDYEGYKVIVVNEEG